MSLTHFSIPNPLTISSPLSPCLPPSLPNLRWPDMHGHVSLRVGISPLLSPPPSLSHHPSVPRLARTRFFACRYFSSPLYPSLPISPPFGAQTCTDTFLSRGSSLKLLYQNHLIKLWLCVDNLIFLIENFILCIRLIRTMFFLFYEN